MKPSVHADDRDYQKHLAETQTREFQERGERVRGTFASPSGVPGPATDEDLAAYAQWEMREAIYWLEPAVGRADQDGFHASCCIMRANAALDIIKRRHAR